MLQSQGRSSIQKHEDKQNRSLQKINTFRLYSKEKWKPEAPIEAKVPKSDTAIIELVFSHPNLLFIKPSKVIEPREISKMEEYRLMHEIVARKKPRQTHKNKQKDLQKPSTAPCDAKGREAMLSPESTLKSKTHTKQFYKREVDLSVEVQGCQKLSSRMGTGWNKRTQLSSNTSSVRIDEKYKVEKIRRKRMFQEHKNKTLTQYIMAEKLYKSIISR